MNIVFVWGVYAGRGKNRLLGLNEWDGYDHYWSCVATSAFTGDAKVQEIRRYFLTVPGPTATRIRIKKAFLKGIILDGVQGFPPFASSSWITVVET